MSEKKLNDQELEQVTGGAPGGNGVILVAGTDPAKYEREGLPMGKEISFDPGSSPSEFEVMVIPK